MANRRNVKRSTVLGYVYLSLTQLERALSAALRCERVSETEHAMLVKAYRNLSGVGGMLDHSQRVIKNRRRTR